LPCRSRAGKGLILLRTHKINPSNRVSQVNGWIGLLAPASVLQETLGKRMDANNTGIPDVAPIRITSFPML
jgi:hypothetical protein